MATFSNHKVSASQLLEFIPEALLTHLSATTKVDYYAKVLHRKKIFYLLLYALLDNEKLSQRTLEDTFNGPIFKALFNMDEAETVRRSSISERLAKIEPAYFKEIFECIYDQFATYYRQTERAKYNLIRVDSTLVAEAASKLQEGIDQKNGTKLIKYSVSFDGMLPASVEVFDTQTYLSEDNALLQAVLAQVKKDPEHQNIYVIDRGLQSSRTMQNFSNQQVKFVIRAKENRKYEELKLLIQDGQDVDLGELKLLKDSLVHLYTGIPILNKRGNKHYREEKLETPFRLLVANSKTDPKKEFWFLTNDVNRSPKTITDDYRRRWDIEVFFRFLKQQLNVSHLVSLNKNGISVLIYMTLIVAMLLLIYQKANQIGYKTAKRRFTMEIRELAIAILITLSGGNPNKVFKT